MYDIKTYQFLRKLPGRCLRALIPQRVIQRLIIYVSNVFIIDIFSLALFQRGFQGWDFRENGESALVRSILPKLIIRDQPILFDVGAHKGKFSELLRSSFPSSKIFSFEANPKTHENLSLNTQKLNLELFNTALTDGSEPYVSLYYPAKDQTSAFNSLHPKSMLHMTPAKELVSERVPAVSLDQFAKDHRLTHIDFIKLDIEGSEFDALKGAQNLIRSGSLPLIQFEFTFFNVERRLFLSDFYALLPNYFFFRISNTGLRHIPSIRPWEEFFALQNILAVEKELAKKNVHILWKNRPVPTSIKEQ